VLYPRSLLGLDHEIPLISWPIVLEAAGMMENSVIKVERKENGVRAVF